MENTRYRVLFDGLDGFREGSVVEASQLSDTGYALRGRMIEEVPEDTPLTSELEAQRNKAADNPATATDVALSEAESAKFAEALGIEPGRVKVLSDVYAHVAGLPRRLRESDAQAILSALGLIEKTPLEAVLSRVQELTSREDASWSPEGCEKIAAALHAEASDGETIVAEDVLKAVDKLIKRADEAKEDGEKVLKALREENERLKAELEAAKKPAPKKKASGGES